MSTGILSNPLLLALGAGGLAGLALLGGSLIALRWQIPQVAVASIMAFGAGVLLSALSFDLVLEAEHLGGFLPTAAGFSVGAAGYVLANYALAKAGARHRRRSSKGAGSGPGIAVGALLDGIPESAVLGLSLAAGGAVSLPVLLAIIISNVPEGLSSSAAFRRSGHSKRFIITLWSAMTVAFALASLAGYAWSKHLGPGMMAAVIAIAAGAILAMVADTMIPEAFEQTHAATGLLATAGFLLSFWIHLLA